MASAGDLPGLVSRSPAGLRPSQDPVPQVPRWLSHPGDPHEREAEQVADRVMRAPEGHCDGCDETSPCAECAGGGPAGAPTPPAIGGLGGGRPLDQPARELMEPRFGADFGAVRIHTDARAAQIAAALTADALTTGSHIVFAAGRYAPRTAGGQRLLAHELAHVVQRARGTVSPVQRQQAAAPEQEAPAPEADDPLSDPIRRGVPAGYSWGLVVSPRFHSMPSADVAARLLRDEAGPQFIDASTVRFGGTLGVNGWWSFIHPERGEIGRVIGRSDVAGEPGQETQVFSVYLVYALPPAGRGGAAKGGTGPAASAPKQDEPGSGSLAGAAKEAGKALKELPSPVTPAPDLLKDPVTAQFYLQIIEHFSGRPITPADQTAAANGLDDAEIRAIVGFSPLRGSLTALFTQALAEFKAAGGTDFEQYKLLIQTIDEQFTRGNPTAALNHMKVGKGFPETGILGIVDRQTGILLYDQYGLPLAALGGGGLMRDHGYIGSRNESRFGFNIANIEDPALRQLLNALRQSFGDPTRMAIEAAGIYFENIERVNAEVRAGLSAEVIQKFEDMVVPFVGFIAGHAVSSFLIRFPNPQVALVGVALKGLLTVAGYVMDIEFAAEALSRLTKAAAELIKVEKTTQGQLTKLSEAHIKSAAIPIRQMVADIALMAGTHALGALIGAAAKGGKKLKIECTTCKIDEVAGRAEEKAPENVPPEKPEVPVLPTTRGFAVEDFHLDRVGYQSLRKGGSVRAIDGIRGGDVEVITRGGEVIKRYTRPDAVSVKSTTITNPDALSRKVIPELDALRGRYTYARGGIEINGLGQRRYDLVFEEGAFANFTKETLTTLAALKQRAGSIVFRWYINVGGHEFYGPDYLKAQGRE